MNWLQSLNAGKKTVPIVLLIVAALIFDTPAIIVLGIWCLIARAESNKYRRLLAQEIDRKQKLIDQTWAANNGLMHQKGRLISPHHPEDEIRSALIERWRREEE